MASVAASALADGATAVPDGAAVGVVVGDATGVAEAVGLADGVAAPQAATSNATMTARLTSVSRRGRCRGSGEDMRGIVARDMRRPDSGAGGVAFLIGCPLDPESA